jgi:DNA-binding response OmpR family regulator
MGKRILAVENDADILEILDIILTSEGYEVITSATGQDIIPIIQICKPDIVLMDIRLGFLDGREVCKTIKTHEKTKHTPVFLMSAHAREEDVMKDSFADGFIPKPFDFDKLRSGLQSQLSV